MLKKTTVYLIIQSIQKIIQTMGTLTQEEKTHVENVLPEREFSLETFLNFESTKNPEPIDAIKTRFYNHFRSLFPYDFSFEEFTAFYRSETKKTETKKTETTKTQIYESLTTEIFKHWRPAFFGEFNALENKYALETGDLIENSKSRFTSKTGFSLSMLTNWHGVKKPFVASDLVLEVFRNDDDRKNCVIYGSCWQEQVEFMKSRGFGVVVVKCLNLYFVVGFKGKNLTNTVENGRK